MCLAEPRRRSGGIRGAVLSAIVLWALAALAGCTAKTEPPAVEEAYSARSSVALLEDLHPTSPVVAQLEMGERVRILGRRRSFVRVRTEAGAEGWAKGTELISPEVRDHVMQVREQTAADPPQGEVRALQTLNVHLEPYRWSPTIYRLSQDEGAQLLRHQVADRMTQKPEEGEAPPPPDGQDDWYLVRLETGRAGWVLASGLYSGIPEEVAQYAERRRIVSYFPLGDDEQGGARKRKTWLWTQVSRANPPYDFDLLRIFVWSHQHEAYQTAKIERGLQGYLPVVVLERVETEHGAGPGFAVVVDSGKGGRVQRTYALLKGHIYKVSEKPPPPPPAPIQLAQPEPDPTPPASLVQRLLSWWKNPAQQVTSR